MTTRTSRSSAPRPGTTPPRGATPPRPGLAAALLRAAVLAALALTLFRQPLLGVAGSLRSQASVTDTPADRRATSLPRPDTAAIAAGALQLLLRPEIQAPARLVALAGLVGVLAELLLAAAAMPLQAARSRRQHARSTFLRILLPQAAASSRAAPPPDSGAALLRALASAPSPHGRVLGGAPWCTLVLSAEPGGPAQFGIQVAGGRAQRRTLDAIRAAVAGLYPDAVIEPAPDPLGISGARRAAWREYALALPPEYPLRTAEDPAALLGPLAAAVRPRGPVYVELQIALRPFGGVSGWALNRGWRGRATALKMRLEQRADYALAADIAALEAKVAGAPLEVTLRAVALAEGGRSEADARAALDAVEAALAIYQARTASRLQRLVRVAAGRGSGGGQRWRTRAPRYAPPTPLLLPLHPWRAPDILTPAELAGLWSPPAPSLGPLVRWLPCRRIAAPPHAFLGTGEERVALGRAARPDGEIAPVGPGLRDLRQILHVTAGMGAGKTRLLANLCAQLMPHGFTLIDGKGDDSGGSLVATVRGLLPLEDERRLVIIDPLDAEWPVGLNPLAGVDASRPGGADLALGQVLAIFARLDPETWAKAPGMAQFASMATLAVVEGEPRPTLAHIKQALLDERYRARLLERVTNVEVVTFWRQTYPQLGEGQRSSRDALLRRIDALLTSETTRHLMCQQRPTCDMHEAIEHGLVVLVPVPDMSLGGLAGPVAMLVFQAFIRAAFAREGSDATRASYPLVVDELQVLAAGGSPDVEVAVTRLRSLGIPAVYAHQALAQLGDLAGLMMINAANRVILQTQEPDASVYARAYAAAGITAADISEQGPNEHQYATFRCAGAATGVFSMRPLPWPAPAAADAPPYHGPDWRTLAPEPPSPLDGPLLRMAYGDVAAPAVAELAALPEDEWAQVLARWDAIRLHQRRHILAHPGCIPERLERQRWLSRLLAARPRALAAAEYARVRSI